MGKGHTTHGKEGDDQPFQPLQVNVTVFGPALGPNTARRQSKDAASVATSSVGAHTLDSTA